jgi:uncharacterized protein (TIGR02271 family)
MENTVVGVYDSYAQANAVVNELTAAGFSRDAVQLRPDTQSTAQEGVGTTVSGQSTSVGSSIANFFRAMFGMDEQQRDERDIYAEAVRRGSQVVTVDAANDEMRDRAIEIMNRHDPVDIDERATHWRSQGWTAYNEHAPFFSDSEIEKDRQLYAQGRQAAGTTTGEEVARIPVVEEELRVGKREVQRGGVRVYQRVRERPVQEQVQLREEQVNVKRQQVDRPATEADLAAFKEGTVEVRETAEEAVVSKTAHVVEEVAVTKEATQHTEEISDTVRRTDVEVEQLSPTDMKKTGTDYADTKATADDADFRRHWQSAYGQSGGRYEDYDAAYRYGSTQAGTAGFRNYRWEDAEPNLRRNWEASHPESAWDKVKDAVRYGAEKVTGRR